MFSRKSLLNIFPSLCFSRCKCNEKHREIKAVSLNWISFFFDCNIFYHICLCVVLAVFVFL